MRLYDKVLTQAEPEIRSAMLAAAPHTTVLNASNIAEYISASSQMTWATDDYPYSRPPWNTFFVEWDYPRQTLTQDGWRDEPPGQAGVAGMVFNEITPQMRRALRDEIGPQRRPPDDETFDAAKALELATIRVETRQFLFFKGRLIVTPVVGTWLLDDGGKILWAGVNLLEEDSQLRQNLMQLGREGLGFLNFQVCWMAFTFCNCKNVERVDVTEQEQPPPKIRRRLKLPEVRRWTLNIGLPSTRTAREYHEGEKGHMPLHLCRGHFATYGPDKPLFGNPKNVGRYWHPPHVRGKKENGEVVKDYSVVLPAESQPPETIEHPLVS